MYHQHLVQQAKIKENRWADDAGNDAGNEMMHMAQATHTKNLAAITQCHATIMPVESCVWLIRLAGQSTLEATINTWPIDPAVRPPSSLEQQDILQIYSSDAVYRAVDAHNRGLSSVFDVKVDDKACAESLNSRTCTHAVLQKQKQPGTRYQKLLRSVMAPTRRPPGERPQTHTRGPWTS